MQAGEGRAGKRLPEADQPRAGHAHDRDGAVRRRDRETDLHLEPLARQLEGPPLERLDREHEQHAARARAPEQAGPVRAVHLPACAGREPAAVRLNRCESGPPVREVVRRGKEGPDVLARCKQLAGGLDARHAWTLARRRRRRVRHPGRMARTLLAALALALAAVGGAPGARRTPTPFPSISPLCHRADFASQGGIVRAALCRPADSEQLPALVVLHGCGGFGGIDEVLARDLSAHGVATFYIDYFGLTP